MAGDSRDPRSRGEAPFQGGSRGLFHRSDSVPREDRHEFADTQQQQEDSSFVRTAAQVAMLGFGARALGRVIPKDIWIQAAHHMGSFGHNRFGRFMEARTAAILRRLDPAAAKEYASKRTSTELDRVITDEINPLLREMESSLTGTTARDQMERRIALQLKERFGASHDTTHLAGLDFGSVLKGSEAGGFNNQYKVISERSIETIRGIRERVDPTGRWFDKLVIDPGLHRSTAGKVYDTRWASGRRLGEMAYGALSFKVPFVNFRPVDLFAPFFRMTGPGKLASPVGQGVTLADGITTPQQGINYFLGGELLNIGSRGVTELAPGRVFRAQVKDTLAEANLARFGGLPSQQPGFLSPVTPTTRKGFFESIQDLLGMGPKYRTQPSVIGSLIESSRVRAGVRSGKVKWQPFENVRVESLPYAERLRAQAEATASGRTYRDIAKDVVPSPYRGKPFSALSRPEQLAHTIYGKGGKYGKFVEVEGERQFATTGLLGTSTVPSPRGNLGLRDVRLKEATLKPDATKVPIESFVYEDTLRDKAAITGRFLTTRLNALIGTTLGVGFRPSTGKFGVALDMLKISAVGSLAFDYLPEAIKYTNYLSRRVTSGFGALGWRGIGPLDIAAGAFKYGTLGAAGLKDAFGITGAAQYAEDLMPGSVHSPLSGLARTVAPVGILGKHGPKGMLAGLGISTVLGGPSDIFGIDVLGAGAMTSAKELADIYSGEQLVDVKRGRWWMLGRSGFHGEGLQYREPHWLAKFQSGYKYTDVLYGSEGEYFKQVSKLPTPHNLFGLGRDKDYYAKMHQHSRPYPVAPSGQRMHEGEALPPAPLSPRGLEPGTLEQLGYPSIPSTPQATGSTADIGMRAKSHFNKLTEFLGIYKFLGETAFGRMDSGAQLQDAGTITDPSRLYWDKQLGGLFGMTELFRRYRPQYNDVGATLVNDIPNTMPAGMPGRRSMFAKDRSYYLDFTAGDPYAKIPGGVHRLPGPGYEALHRLHSGTAGIYDPMDMFLILSDVAPYSEAYKHYETIVSSWQAAGQLDAYWGEKYKGSLEARDERLLGFGAEFVERRFTGSAAAKQSIRELNEGVKYNAVERTVGAAWEGLTLDVLPKVGRAVPFGTVLTHKLFPHHTAEQDYLERQVYGSRFSNWSDPWAGFIQPKISTLWNEDPLTATAGGAAIGLLTAGNPMAGLMRAGAGAAFFGGGSTVRAGVTGQMTGGYVPGFRRREQEATEYLDNLNYLRYQTAIDRARDIGRGDIAGKIQEVQSRRTMAGLDLSQGPGLAFSALGAIPTPERTYFKHFATVQDQGTRERILDMAPSYMRDIYKSIYDVGSIRRNNRAAVGEYFADREVPQEGWMGWHPAVQNWQIIARSQDTPGNSISIDAHRQHISTAMIRQSSIMMPGAGVPPELRIHPSFTDEAISWIRSTVERHDMHKHGMQQGLENIRVDGYQGLSNYDRGHRNINITRDRTHENYQKIAAMIGGR